MLIDLFLQILIFSYPIIPILASDLYYRFTSQKITEFKNLKQTNLTSHIAMLDNCRLEK